MQLSTLINGLQILRRSSSAQTYCFVGPDGLYVTTPEKNPVLGEREMLRQQGWTWDEDQGAWCLPDDV
jgi:hypothetical protein